MDIKGVYGPGWIPCSRLEEGKTLFGKLVKFKGPPVTFPGAPAKPQVGTEAYYVLDTTTCDG